jgi:uncharacterized protein involved in outer membrane biogenesis
MNGVRKRIAIGLGILAGVILMGVLALVLFFPADLVRDRLVMELERKIQRPVHVGGGRLTLLPTLGVELSDVWIGEKAEIGRPRFALASARVGVRLLPLLRREVVVTEIEIDRPEVEVVLADAAGHAAVQQERASDRLVPPLAQARSSHDTDALGHPVQAERPESGSRDRTLEPLYLRIDRFVLRHGRVRIRSADGDPVLDLAGITEELEAEMTRAGDLRLEGQTRIDTLGFQLPMGELGRRMQLDLEKRLQYLAGSDSLTIETAHLDLGGLRVSVTGGVGAVSSGHPSVRLDLQGEPAEVADILGYLPSGVLPQMRGIRSQGTVGIDASVRGPLTPVTSSEDKLDYRLDLTIAEGEIKHPDLSAPVEKISLRLMVTPSFLEVVELSASTGSSRIRARSRISSYGSDPTIDAALDADVDLHEVTALRPDLSGTRISGQANARIAVQGRMKDPDQLAVAGTLDLRSVRIEGPGMAFPIEDLSGRILIHEKDLTVQEMVGRLGASDFLARGTLGDYRALQPGTVPEEPATVDLSIDSRLLVLDELMPPPAKLRQLRAAAGKQPLSPAEVTAASLMPLSGRIAFRADRIQSSRFGARDAHGVAKLDRGLVTIERLELNALGGSVAVQGTVDYRTPQNPRFALRTRIRNAQAPMLLETVKSLNRFTRMGGFLTGAIDATAESSGDLNDTLGVNLMTLKSIGNLSVRDAKISNHPIQVRVADFLGAPSLRSLTVSDWFQPIRIENGRLVIDKLSLKGQQIEVSASGWQSLNGEMELSFDLVLPQELSTGIRKHVPQELVPVLLGGAGSRPLIPLRVRGRYDDPHVSVDTDRLSAAAQAQAQDRLAAEPQRLEEDAKRRSREFLEGLKDAAVDSTSIKEKAKQIEKELKGTLKDLFKKK